MAGVAEHEALNELKAQIVRRGWKFKDLAGRLGITNRHLSEVLNGRARLTQRLGQQIHEVTAIPMSDIPLESTMKILVCDPIADDGVEIFRKAGVDVDVKTGMSKDELKKAVERLRRARGPQRDEGHRGVLEATSHLQVVGRAGVGVDNIDLAAATEKGVVVVNAPTGNIISAAEHAIALMLSLARHIPEANVSLRSGKWERSKLLGIEVRGEDARASSGSGRWARRSRGGRAAWRCGCIAHDPFVPEERARVLGVDLVSMDRAAEGVRLHHSPHDAHRRHEEPDWRRGDRADEADGARHQHGARRDRRRGGAREGAEGQLDRAARRSTSSRRSRSPSTRCSSSITSSSRRTSAPRRPRRRSAWRWTWRTRSSRCSTASRRATP